MTDDRWERVVDIFEQALQRPAAERMRFVDDSVQGDNALRNEVIAMLQAENSVHPLFDMSPDRLADAVREPGAQSLAGRSIGVYTLRHEVGRGGMATVYHAEDTKHRRSVALKLLDASASSALGSERFRREIDVVAGLQHHNVLPLYDSGESEGLLYYVMPLVSGGTLRDRLASGERLPISDVRRITSQVAAGLDYAHRRGVVHRDVKPANILLEEEHATIADFGIAQRPTAEQDDRLTHTGVFVGTPAYMSPEHAAGDPLDARSDTYSLACVVFEMLTGTPPYQGFTVGILAKHMRDPVPSASALRPDIPQSVDAVLRQALAKNPADRFASTGEFSRAFDAAFDAASSAPVAKKPALGRRSLAALAIAAAVLLATIFAVRSLGSRASAPTSIAVLPFVNMSADSSNEYFSDGVTEEITGALAQLGRVRVTPRTTAFAYKGKTGDIRQIGHELGVSRILEGSVRRDRTRVLFVASLYDATNGDRLWSNRYERDWGTVLALQTEIAGTIAEQLRLTLVPAERTRLAGRHTVNADAYDSYLKGRHFFDLRTSQSLPQALSHFQHALTVDSTYARAYAGLADTYSIMAWTGLGAPLELFPHAEHAARRALALDSTIAEAYVSLGIIHTFHTWDWPAADRAFTRALALDSTSAVAWFFRAWPLVALGRVDDALSSVRHSRQLDPFSLIVNARVGTILGWVGRLSEAEAALRATLELDPQYPVARLQLARVLSLQGKHNEAVAALPPDTVRFGSFESGIAGVVLARAGLRDRALAAARQLESRPSVPAEGVAGIYAALGDRGTALTWLEKAVDARGVGLLFIAAEPMYASLRSEPRFQQIVQRLKLVTPSG